VCSIRNSGKQWAISICTTIVVHDEITGICFKGIFRARFRGGKFQGIAKSQSQNRDLWFTLPPQQSPLVSWLFSVIPIVLLKFSIFYYISVNSVESTTELKIMQLS